MLKAKIHEIDGNQVVSLPPEIRFSDDELMINKVGDVIMLIPKTAKWDDFRRAVVLFSDN